MDSDEPTTIRDATCLACGCLCDDLDVRVEGGRIVAAERACALGRDWFLADHGPVSGPSATIEGRAAETDSALRRAAGILAASRSPVVLGLTRSSVEAQAEAVAIADRIGASLDPSHSADALPGLLALQRVGRVSATLGEVRNRADSIVFWGLDPMATHPRHLERYSAEPRSRFLPRGRPDRFLAVVRAGQGENATARLADFTLDVDPDRQLAALTALRGLVRGARLDPDRLESATGIHPSPLMDLAGHLREARYGAFFFGEGLGRARGGVANVEAALTLVRDLNTHATGRFVALPIGRAFNAAGAEAVMTWQASAALTCDFSRGHPRFLPHEASAGSRLGRGVADAALVVADDPRDFLAPEALAHLGRIPTVVIAPDATDPSRAATVGLSCATTGIDAGGTVARSDGVSLPLRPALRPSRPTDRQLLRSLGERLRTAAGSPSPHPEAALP
jgi:formylmethanofuran dehydrogenase subunit B